MYATEYGTQRLISTAVEPNPYCRSRECALYGSQNGGEWQRLAVHRKDLLSPVYFQFGAIVLPTMQNSSQSRLMFSGQAVQGLDGRVAVVDSIFEHGESPEQTRAA